MNKQLLITLFIILFSIFAYSQSWKKERYSFLFTTGTSHYIGDLGGGEKESYNPFDIRSIDFPSTKYNIGLGYSYRLFKKISLKYQFRYASLTGFDSNSKNAINLNRNLHFKSNIFENSLEMMFYFIGGKHQLSSVLSGNFMKQISAYFLIGTGAFYYNPKAEYDGNWIELRPLKTEGQGLPATVNNGFTTKTTEKYEKFAMSLNLGLGAEYRIHNSRKSFGGGMIIHEFHIVGCEISYRYTATDYLDDVSSMYYPNDILLSEYGEISAEMSDRRIDKKIGTVHRGNNKFNDSYLFINITYRYSRQKRWLKT